MPSNKKHHYVPRFHLRNFAQDGKNIRLFNFKQKRAIDLANLKNQCYKDYMYGKDGRQEYLLSQIEGGLSTLLKFVLLHDVLPSPLSQAHENICILAVLQYARTLYSAEALNELTDKMWKKVLEQDSRFDHKILNNYKIGFNDPSNYYIGMMLRLYHLIMDLDYRLLAACQGAEFVISDNPVIMYNQLMEFDSTGSHTGLCNKGLQIFLPLSPKRALVFYDSSVYAFEPKKSMITHVPTPQDMLQINALQVASALENIYFHSAAANIYKTIEKGERYRHERKADVTAFEGQSKGNQTSILIQGGKIGIRTNLSLSFVKLLKPAKRWLDERKTPGPKPAVVVRDEDYVKAHTSFSKLVEKGKYDASDFIKYLKDVNGLV